MKEKLVPITDLAQLNVGDMVRNDESERKVLVVRDIIVALSEPRDHEKLHFWYSLDRLKYWGYQQVSSAPRTLSREEARKAIDEGKTVKSVGGRITYKLSGDKMRIEATEGSSPVSIAVHVEMFDIPEGRYEIVGGE